MNTQYRALVVTPVKNAVDNTIATIKSIAASNVDVLHTVYNDYSDVETEKILEQNTSVFGYELIHLRNLTSSPSPNYKTVLQHAQRRALDLGLDLIIVESDVEVKADTFEQLISFNSEHTNSALVGAITVGYDGQVNFPYLKFKNEPKKAVKTNRSLSFCCTLLANRYLQTFDFLNLDSSKDWYDTIISHKALELSFENYILMNVPTLHKPHGSRPWKQLKYTNPLKYYWLKLIKGRDKI